MKKTKNTPAPEQVRQGRDEARERHMAFYFDPWPGYDIAPGKVVEYRFEVAVTNLMAMLEAHEYIGVDWGHDEAGEATLDRRPYPGVPLPKKPSVKHAVENYRDAVITHRDCEELAAKLPQTSDVKQLRAILARMVWHLDGSGREWAAEDLAKRGRSKEAVNVLKEALRLAHDECVPAMKEILSRIDPDDVGLDKASPQLGGTEEKKGTPNNDNPTTRSEMALGDFIREFTDAASASRIASVKNRIQAAARGPRRKISLPEPTRKHKSGEKKYYRPKDLIANWPVYKEALAELPDLKV